MATPQSGIFALGTRAHHHLEFDVRPDVDVPGIADALERLRDSDTGGVNLVIGFGPDLWRRLCSTPPADLGRFERIEGLHDHLAPAAQHDLWVWLHGTGLDVVLDAATAAADVLSSAAVLADETRCFVYHDSRDLTGFIDGTANPSPSDAPAVALIAQGLAGAGGTHVIAQRWVHDLGAFADLDVEAQEHVIGRTKCNSTALPRESRPADAHIMRAELLDAAGAERQIYRRSVPFGDVARRGLYFLAFSAERDRFDGMLARMFGTVGDGLHDRLLDYTRAETGAYYFAPSFEELVAAGRPRPA